MVLDQRDAIQVQGPQLSILKDPTGNWTIEDVSGFHYEEFEVVDKGIPNLGLGPATWWARFRISQPLPSEQEWILEYAFPHVRHLDFYQKVEGRWKQQQGGMVIPLHERAIPHHLHQFPIEKGLLDGQEFYLRISSVGTIAFPLALFTREGLARKDFKMAWQFGLYGGGVLVIFLYNLFLFLARANEATFFIAPSNYRMDFVGFRSVDC